MDEKLINKLTEAVAGLLFVELEASARHVHVTKEQAMILFGHPLTPERPLSQPGQYLARERVRITGPKGSFSNVAVLGPERQEAQVEVSLTDARALGVAVPIKLSGDVANTPGITVEGTAGQITLDRGVMAAQRHIHLTPEDARRFGVRDQQVVRLQTFTQRPVIFENVAVRVSPKFASYVHLDFDEANACGLHKGDLGRILP